jgi:hypothetical protein
MKANFLLKLFVICNITVTLVACSDDSNSPNAVTIIGINPASGPPGTSVTITGTGFSANVGENIVKFNGIVGTVTQASSTEMVALVPEDAASGPVSVEVDLQIANGPSFKVTRPLVTSISLTEISAGSTVTINGDHFGTDKSKVQVLFNEKEGTVVDVTNTSIAAIVPPKAGSGIVKVIVSGAVVVGPNFVYLPTLRVSTLAGNGTFGFQDGPGASAQFQTPLHLCSDSKGHVYVTDHANNRIRKITPTGVVSTFAGNGDPVNGDIGYPRGIASDGDDNIYVSDGCKIKKITPAGVVTIFSGTQTYSCGFTNGAAAQAAYSGPFGLSVDTNGDLIIAERDNHAVRKITGGLTTTLAGGAYGDENGTSAKFRYPHDVSTDESGNVFLLDQSNHKIKKITPAGAVSTFAGSTQGHRDGQGEAARIHMVNAICVDPATGVIYFAEHTGGTPSDSTYIRMITREGRVVTLMGNTFGHQDGNAREAKFYQVHGIDIDVQGNIYLTEQYSRIRKITIE